MDKEDVVGRVIHYMALLVPSLVIIYSLFFSTGDTGFLGIYNLVWYGTQSVHSLSLITMCVSFLIHYSVMKYIMPLARFVISLTFTLFYIYLGGIFWMVNSYLARGKGIILVSVISFFLIVWLVERLDNKHGVINRYNLSEWAPIIVVMLIGFQILGYVGMWQTGFWELMELSDMGIPAANPNQNLFWVFMKVTGFWFILPLINRSGHRAPLRLDPKVLIW